MKKLILLVFAMCLSFTEINAQVYLGNSDEKITDKSLIKRAPVKKVPASSTADEQATANTNKKYEDITDYSVELDFDSKIYGIGIGSDNFSFGMSFGDGYSGGILGGGFGDTYVKDNFLLKGRLHPYLGIFRTDYGGESKEEFTYGLSASIGIGVKVWTTKKGNSAFLTFGYQISAPEFETSKMFDNGKFGVGISFVCW